MNAFVLLSFNAVQFSPVSFVEMFGICHLRKKSLCCPSLQPCVHRLLLQLPRGQSVMWKHASEWDCAPARHAVMDRWGAAGEATAGVLMACRWSAWTFTVDVPFFDNTLSAVLTMLRFEELFPLFCSCTDKHCTWYMLYLISRRICLTERKKCGLALLLFWFAEFEKDNYNACNVSYTCTT